MKESVSVRGILLEKRTGMKPWDRLTYEECGGTQVEEKVLPKGKEKKLENEESMAWWKLIISSVSVLASSKVPLSII